MLNLAELQTIAHAEETKIERRTRYINAVRFARIKLLESADALTAAVIVFDKEPTVLHHRVLVNSNAACYNAVHTLRRLERAGGL
jgi:hypothetical protein